MVSDEILFIIVQWFKWEPSKEQLITYVWEMDAKSVAWIFLIVVVVFKMCLWGLKH